MGGFFFKVYVETDKKIVGTLVEGTEQCFLALHILCPYPELFSGLVMGRIFIFFFLFQSQFPMRQIRRNFV